MSTQPRIAELRRIIEDLVKRAIEYVNGRVETGRCIIGTDVLTTFRTNVRAALADTGTTFPDAMIDEAVFSAVADVSRLAPRELVHVEVLHSRTVTDETFTSNNDNWVDLANYIDMQQSVVVTNNAGTTTYIEDTDYIIDYAQGRIQTLSTGDISNSATHKIDYEKSLRSISISSLTDFIAIDRLEISKSGGQNYQTYISYYQWGDVLWFQARDGTQEPSLSENDHVRVWYKAEHTKPGASASSIPAYMDDVVAKGAVAYALYSKHRERNLQAVTDIATARTQLAIADDDQTAINTLEAAVTTALDSAKTTLALVDALADTPPADAETALDAVITNLGTEAEGLLDDALVLGFNTSIESALDGAAALLDESSSDIKTALDKVVEHLESDTTDPDSAENQLKAGDSLINAANVGSDVAALYARYSEAQVSIARGFVEEAVTLVSQARGQVEEAAQRIQQNRVWLDKVDARINIANTYVAEARERLGIAGALLQAALGYIDEASGRMAQIDRHIQLGLLYIGQARVYQEGADRENQSADRFLFDAQERHRDYWDHLMSRVEMGRPNQRQASVRQNP